MEKFGPDKDDFYLNTKVTSGWKGTCSCVPSGKTYQIVSYSEGTCKEACVVNGKTVTTVCTKIGNQDDLSMSQVKNENGIIASRKKMTCGVHGLCVEFAPKPGQNNFYSKDQIHPRYCLYTDGLTKDSKNPNGNYQLTIKDYELTARTHKQEVSMKKGP